MLSLTFSLNMERSAVYVDGGDNPNFRSYIFTGKAHHTQIADFDQKTQDEILDTIKSWL